MFLFARRFSAMGIDLATTCPAVAERAAALCETLSGVTPNIRVLSGGGRHLHIGKKSEVTKVLAAFGHTPGEVSFSLNYANLENECCLQSFLRGVFLVCGRVTDPSRGYHLEFSVSRVKTAAALETLLKNMGYPPLTSTRSNSLILYYKDSETIEELLTAMGAVNGALEVMNTKIYRDLRNRVNRLTNCEASNIGKTVQASREQLRAIEAIRKHGGGLRSLPDELRQIAKLRVANPDASLSEIGKLCEPPLSRSGVNHRLTKLLEIADKLEEQDQ